MLDIVRKKVMVEPGIELSYLEAGSGRPLLMIPGLGAPATVFSRNIPVLAERHRVIALDIRGVGASDKPAHGYNYHRLACDLDQIMKALDLRDVTVLGHSAGCKIFLSYWEIYDRSRVRSYIHSDDAPCCITDGAFTFEEAREWIEELEGPEPEKFLAKPVPGFVTPSCDLEEWCKLRSGSIAPSNQAKLLRWAIYGDWWNAIDLLDIPVLIFGGKISKNPWQNMEQLHKRLPGSDLYIFGEDEGGAHAMYFENPAKYNSLVTSFMDQY